MANVYASSVFKPGIFQSKVVFCTGGAGTICRRQTEALVSLGANAAILGRKKEVTEKAAAEIQSLRKGSKVIGISADVRDLKSLQDAVALSVKELGRIDFVICGAAGNFIADFRHLSANAFKTVVDIDLIGSFNTVKAASSELIKNKGSVIFVSATLHYYGVQFQSHVGAAKAGIDALSNALAVELGPFGVRFNCIAPGPIDGTEGLARLLPDGAREQAIKAVPLQRLGSINDIADATVFLFSDAASFITGTVSVVDGGAWQTGQMQALAYPDTVLNSDKLWNKMKKAKL
ncbi:hypothetical protein BZA70DRAFT_299309 [Myxozyma melibiosi]|uniref:2,4-dienoyl-CoA reductase [(3E)-enoyl-CoA-producing] n=1 Tax=Myxozyma melibiosi TaxID=54550 RepID=A0ABR1F716_9ASCO